MPNPSSIKAELTNSRLPSDQQHVFPESGFISAIDSLHTPIGYLHVASNGQAITRVSFEDQPIGQPQRDSLVDSLLLKLTAYFAGQPIHFDIPLSPAGSAFQQQVWQQLQQIPYGKTISYKELALAFGGPTFTRAVASANGANPLALVIPCHRVIGSHGELTGYAGGLWRKKWLLEHESPATQISLFE